jgi:hypothetical protein
MQHTWQIKNSSNFSYKIWRKEVIWRTYALIEMIKMDLTKIRCQNVEWINWLTTGFSARLLWGASTVIMLSATQPVAQILAGAWDPFSKMSLAAMAPTQPPIKWEEGLLEEGVKSQAMKLITHLYQVPRVRMSGATPLLPLHAFMPWSGTTLPFLSGFYERRNKSSHSIKLWNSHIYSLASHGFSP